MNVDPPDHGSHRRRCPGSVLLAAAGALLVGFAALAGAYSTESREIADTGNFWFGSDIPRHIRWVENPSHWYRAHLHPASAAVYKGYGAVLRGFGVEKPSFIAVAMPAMLATAGAVAGLGWMLSSAPFFAIAVMIAVLVGPILLFAPVPESHMLGGASLLMQAILVLRAARLGESKDAESPAVGAMFAASIAFGCLAIGFTLTNIAPATVIAWLGSALWRRHLRRGLWTAGACVACGVLLLLYLAETGAVRGPWHPKSIKNEIGWSSTPSVESVRNSVSQVFVSQFGVPPTRRITWKRRPGDVRDGIRVTKDPAFWSIVAAALWIVAFLSLHRAAKGAERTFLNACALALVLVIGEHTAISPDESFLFTPHAWPYIILPLILALARSPRPYASAIPAAGAVAASALQSIAGFHALFRNLPGV